jgi:hypothetical protein
MVKIKSKQGKKALREVGQAMLAWLLCQALPAVHRLLKKLLGPGPGDWAATNL